MRKQDLHLRTLARQGDALAKLRLGRIYLSGTESIPRNIGAGLSYLRGTGLPIVSADVAVTIAESLQLEEILEHDQLDVLKLAASRSPQAQLKLAVWLLLTGEHTAAVNVLERTPAAWGNVLAALKDSNQSSRLRTALWAAAAAQPMDTQAVVRSAINIASRRKDLPGIVSLLAASVDTSGEISQSMHDAVVEAVGLAEAPGHSLGELEIPQVQASLERASSRGDIKASYLLGRALCGINCGGLPWQRIVAGTNLRKGSALLLRVADSGNTDAWLHLYRISSDYRCSVANPQLARFCLEKAAYGGSTEAQRRLGALEMREAMSVSDAERALDLLFRASAKGDSHAKTLLASLVLPVRGSDDDARRLIADVKAIDPWLAIRLRLARYFGLTKQEALSVDPAAGLRPWGLVVGQNPFIMHARLSSPRAVPAISEEALSCAVSAAALFRDGNAVNDSVEGNPRKRAMTLRRVFDRLELKEAMFFATANSSERDALRIGPRWAHKTRHTLKLALSEHLP